MRFLNADVTELPAYQGPFDAVVFNMTLAAQASPVDALRRATLLLRPGARVVISERNPEPGETAAALDVAGMTADLPLVPAGEGAAAGAAGLGKVMGAPESPADVPDASGPLWVFQVPPLYKLRDAVTLVGARKTCSTTYCTGARHIIHCIAKLSTAL